MNSQHVSPDLTVALNAIGQPLFVLDSAGRVTYHNAAAQQEFGVAQGHRLRVDHTGGTPFATVGLVDTRQLALKPYAAGWAYGACSRAERRKIQQEASDAAYRDLLTGLPNRMAFNLAAASALAEGEQPAPFSIVLLDFDYFKQVNDQYGFDTGDQALAAAAALVRQVLPADSTVARLGGDEFALILRGPCPVVAAQLTTALQTLGATPVVTAAGSHALSASAGVAHYPLHGLDTTTLLRNAAAALIDAKQGGRGDWRVYDEGKAADARYARKLADAIRSALPNGELRLAYQPQACPKSGRVASMEALLRWEHPLLGKVPADKAVAAAEATGAIHAIGLWVMRTALKQALAWRASGRLLDSIAVNVSPLQFRDPAFASHVGSLLAELQVPEGMLELEITENALLDDEHSAFRAMHDLRGLGVRFSLDDFGTGYSSLALLGRIPVDKVKLDRSFLQYPEGDRGRTLLEAAAQMTRSLGFSLVLEGVENDGHLMLSRQLGVASVQGYLLSPPVPAEQAITYLPLRIAHPATYAQ